MYNEPLQGDKMPTEEELRAMYEGHKVKGFTSGWVKVNIKRKLAFWRWVGGK